MSTTQIPTWMQDEVLERDGWKCLCCERAVHRWRGKTRSDSASIDHIVPDNAIHRGLTMVDNLQTLCRDCNSRKGSTIRDYRPKPPSEQVSPHETVVMKPRPREAVNVRQITVGPSISTPRPPLVKPSVSSDRLAPVNITPAPVSITADEKRRMAREKEMAETPNYGNLWIYLAALFVFIMFLAIATGP